MQPNTEKTNQDQTPTPINFYPIPQNAHLIITTEERSSSIEDLVSLAMHLSIDNPRRKVRYTIEIEGEQ